MLPWVTDADGAVSSTTLKVLGAFIGVGPDENRPSDG